MAELPISDPRVVLRVPSSPSSRARKCAVQGEMPLVRVPCFGRRRHYHREPEVGHRRSIGGTRVVMFVVSIPSP